MDNALEKCRNYEQSEAPDKTTTNKNKLPLETKAVLECNAIILLMLSILFLN